MFYRTAQYYFNKIQYFLAKALEYKSMIVFLDFSYMMRDTNLWHNIIILFSVNLRDEKHRMGNKKNN